jgi:hypothetical protein
LIEVFKRALWLKKAILMIFFHGKKGHFATKKRALAKTWGGLANMHTSIYYKVTNPMDQSRPRAFYSLWVCAGGGMNGEYYKLTQKIPSKKS